jgi:peptide chain release factor 2
LSVWKTARQKSANSWCIFDWSEKELALTELQKKAEDPELWNDRQNAQKVMKDLTDLRDEIEDWKKLTAHIQNLIELAQLEDESLREELESETTALETDLKKRQISVLLSGPYDKGNAFLSINAGAGGTDSQDWAAMLQRMYLRWAERRGYEVELIDLTEGEEAGIKSTTIAIRGKYAYGYLKSEKGVHRLVRLSPFDSAHRRHTSFAEVAVMPEASDDLNIQINPEDLRIDIYRSSGAGGQNVQKNSTAVRLLHIPTGIIVTCQNERSQMQNRENAMRVLRSRLLDIEREKQEAELSQLRGEFKKIEWGSQIRSYVLHPYQLVKDHRTEHEVGNAQAVLDGDTDSFIEAYLQAQ